MNRACHGTYYRVAGVRFYRCLRDSSITHAGEGWSEQTCGNCGREILAGDIGEVRIRERIVYEFWEPGDGHRPGQWRWHSEEIRP